jgi:putative ABC transport system permease protein
MNISQNISQAFSNLWTAKLRTLLAMLGILVGTGSVVAMVSSGELATRAALAQFETLGTNLLAVSISDSDRDEGKNTVALTLNDVDAMPVTIPAIEHVAPYSMMFAPVMFHGHIIPHATIVGSTEALQLIINIHIAEGRFISDFDHLSKFCVIGQQIYQRLQQQGFHHPIGMQLQLGEHYFTIVGIAASWPENAFFYQNINETVIIPLLNLTQLTEQDSINNLVMRINTTSKIDPLKEAIEQYIVNITPGKRFFFRSAEQLIKSMSAQRKTLTLLLGVIGSIALFVGGIGVMNIMLVSVVERRREIGIRRAIGAKRRDILFLFLMEAITLTTLGGLMGVIVGIGSTYIIATFNHWHFMIFWLPPLVGFTISSLIGIFFGLYPAYKAARLDPIIALRSE